jgi:hypothetical protein
MIDKLLEPFLAPFKWLRSAVFKVKQTPTQIKGEISRAKGQVGQVKSDFQYYKQDIQDAKGKAGELKAKAGGVKMVGSGANNGANASAQAAAAPAPQPAKPVKMGLFSKSKKCPQCGQKLHATWEECPYCGWGKSAGGGGGGGGGMAAPMPSGGGKQRTVALDLGGGGKAMPGAVADGIVGWFIPLEGGQAGELFQLRGRVTVGTADDNDIVMQQSPSISGHHCEFVATPNGFRLNDLGSTNGTFVNDKRVNTHDLIDNDNVRLGKVNFKYKSMV